MADYPYIKADLLNTPNYYMYSQYQGVGFQEAYLQSRHDRFTEISSSLSIAVEELAQITSATWDYKSAVLDKLSDIELDWKLVQKAEVFDTAKLLSALAKDILISEKRPGEGVYRLLSVFIKKFEVFKKVFAQYNPSIRKVGDEFQDISVYVLLALNILLYNERIENLKFLNCALKLNDLICSAPARIDTDEVRIFALASIRAERECIFELWNSKIDIA